MPTTWIVVVQQKTHNFSQERSESRSKAAEAFRTRQDASPRNMMTRKPQHHFMMPDRTLNQSVSTRKEEENTRATEAEHHDTKTQTPKYLPKHKSWHTNDLTWPQIFNTNINDPTVDNAKV